jgi:hypothetical protein
MEKLSHPLPPYFAFAGATLVAEGALCDVAVMAWRARDAETPVLVFDTATGKVVDLDLRGDEAEVRARHAPVEETRAEPGRGRPKLGVTAREVTLLPRHWDWLAAQPGGASAALRRLVEAARKADDGVARRDAAYRFMSALCGDFPDFEEASRALFAGDRARLDGIIGAWPKDAAESLRRMLG